MVEERTVEHPDGTIEHSVDHGGGTTVVERRGGGGAILIGLAILIAVIVGAWYLIGHGAAQNNRDDAIAGAAKSVGSAADKVGDAVGGNGS